MKILMIHNRYRQPGGEDAAFSTDQQLLQRNGAEVIAYTRHNNEIEDFGIRNRLQWAAGTIYSRRTRSEITRLVAENRPDLAYVHNVFAVVSPSVYHVLHKLKIPTVQVLHNFRFLCPQGSFYTHGQICERCKGGAYWNAVRYRCYRESYMSSALYGASIGLNRLTGMLEKIDAFICLTDSGRQKMREAGIPGERLFVRPNCIDTSIVQPKFEAGSYALYLGRLVAEKGLWTLLGAFERLPEMQLKIGGSGPIEKALQAYIAQRNIRNIELLGFKGPDEKWELLRNCAFIVLPSELYEAFGLTVIEAYAAGKPAIGSNIGGLPQVIENQKTGLLFEPGNVDDLVEKIRYLGNRPDETQRMGRCGRAVAETKFSPAATYEGL